MFNDMTDAIQEETIRCTVPRKIGTEESREKKVAKDDWNK